MYVKTLLKLWVFVLAFSQRKKSLGTMDHVYFRKVIKVRLLASGHNNRRPTNSKNWIPWKNRVLHEQRFPLFVAISRYKQFEKDSMGMLTYFWYFFPGNHFNAWKTFPPRSIWSPPLNRYISICSCFWLGIIILQELLLLEIALKVGYLHPCDGQENNNTDVGK